LQLKTGHALIALSLSNTAIKLSADRWEAHGIAATSLMILKRYSEATAEFNIAIGKSPKDQQAGLIKLRDRCVLAEMTPAKAIAVPTQTPPGAALTAKPTVPAAVPPGTNSNPHDVQQLAWRALAASLAAALNGEGAKIVFDAKHTETYTRYLVNDGGTDCKLNYIQALAEANNDEYGWVDQGVIDFRLINPEGTTQNGNAITITSKDFQDLAPGIEWRVRTRKGDPIPLALACIAGGAQKRDECETKDIRLRSVTFTTPDGGQAVKDITELINRAAKVCKSN